MTEKLTLGTLTVGTLSAEPGTKTRGTVPADLGTLTVDIPLTLVNGARPGPRVVITAGVHGGEFTGIDAATRLAALLEPGEVRGQIVLCPVANPPAVYQGRLGVSPVDGVNINRVFPGDPEGGPTERLAAWLFTHLLDGAEAYIDLHSGGIDEVLRDFVGYRLTGNPELDARTADMAHSVGIEDVILGLNAEGGNSHAAAARQGIPAILVETGDLGERDPAIARRLVDGLYGVLARLGVLESETRNSTAVREWVWVAGVTSDATGLWYPEFSLGDDVTEGQVIGRVIDPADGREHKIHTPASGRVFYGMHGLTVAPGTELAAIAAPAPREPAP
ncbi:MULTISPECIES: succinylglutamate desuccinylase/aspartoacylase family protein [Streptomyces]|uniref:succinylglutamate desuccinylase/aspartoacylase family protein n=1 Tax=Streptomyces TaxID=1883 RepID=UPI002035B347|nr:MULTISPECIES: succinylglutamate desuccinylase/aspartoacylase family protein [Streptomyces]UUA11552.1 succinylglutamate desuccinylase/aspartoacylase family protein [Streptomyces koelreuteriae]UUA19148.1 succinylglutamate desuccinylase/aspartoacylase family protein [Streptomyces sp. CRCS-T-1]